MGQHLHSSGVDSAHGEKADQPWSTALQLWRPWIGLCVMAAFWLFTTLVFSSRSDPLTLFLYSARIHPPENKTHGSARTNFSSGLAEPRPRIELHPEEHVHRGALVRLFEWTVTSGLQRPDGVLKRVFLINGTFLLRPPSPLIRRVCH